MLLLSHAKKIALVCAAVLIIVQQGCASKPVKSPRLSASALSGERIGVVIKQDETSLKISKKGVGASMREGAANGAIVGARIFSGMTDSIGFLIALPVGAVLGGSVGAIYGAFTSEDVSKCADAETIFRANLKDIDFEHSFTERLVTLAKERCYALHLMEDQISGNVNANDYQIFSRKDVSLIIELSEITIELRRADASVNCPRLFVTSIRTKVIRTVDGIVLDDRIISNFQRDSHTLDEWTQNNGILFREKVSIAPRGIAEEVVKDLLLQGCCAQVNKKIS